MIVVDSSHRIGRRGLFRWGGLATAGAVVAGAPPAAGSDRIPADARPGGAYDRYVAQLAAAGRFSGVVLLSHRGRTVLSRSYGLADRERGIRNHEGIAFTLSSAGKSFNAIAILQLAQQGRLTLTDTVGRHLTGFADDIASRVTIHHMLTGTSGLNTPEEDVHRVFHSRAEVHEYQEQWARRSQLVGTPGLPNAFHAGAEPAIPALIVEAMQEAVSEPETHQYPSNRGRADFREAVSEFYQRRFGVEDLDPATEIIPAIGAKECIFNLNLAFLDPDDVALASDPGYPVYTAGPTLVGASSHLMPLRPDHGFTPDLAAIPAEIAQRAKLLFINYPNNPTGAIVPDGFFERVVEYARVHDILVVHDNAYSETTYDCYRAPSFLQTPGAKDVGVEVFSLSNG